MDIFRDNVSIYMVDFTGNRGKLLLTQIETFLYDREHFLLQLLKEQYQNKMIMWTGYGGIGFIYFDDITNKIEKRPLEQNEHKRFFEVVNWMNKIYEESNGDLIPVELVGFLML